MFIYHSLLLYKTRIFDQPVVNGNFYFVCKDGVLGDVNVFIKTESYDTKKQSKFWNEISNLLCKYELTGVPIFGSFGYSPIIIFSSFLVDIGLEKELKENDIDSIYKIVLKISEILSMFMPFEGYFDIPENFYFFNKESWGFVEPSENFDFDLTKENSGLIISKYPEDYLFSKKPIFINKLNKYNYLYSSIRLIKESKRAFYEKNLHKSLVFLISAIENFYENYEDDEGKKIGKELSFRSHSKVARLEEFLRVYLDNQDISKIPEARALYSLRSDYLHKGDFKDFPHFWFFDDKETLDKENESYNKYYLSLQILYKSIRNYLFNLEKDEN